MVDYRSSSSQRWLILDTAYGHDYERVKNVVGLRTHNTPLPDDMPGVIVHRG